MKQVSTILEMSSGGNICCPLHILMLLLLNSNSLNENKGERGGGASLNAFLGYQDPNKSIAKRAYEIWLEILI